MNDDGKPVRPSVEDFQAALQSMDTYVDVSVQDLMELTRRAEHFANQHLVESIKVAQVMSQPVHTVHLQTSLAEAAHLIVSQHISGLPVVDDTGHLAGIITEADFLRALGVPPHHPSHNLWHTLESLFTHLARHPDLEAPDEALAPYIAHDVITVRPDQDLHEVIAAMKQHRVKRVVVCDAQRQVLGMVTRSDLVRVFFDRYTQGTTA